MSIFQYIMIDIIYLHLHLKNYIVLNLATHIICMFANLVSTSLFPIQCKKHLIFLERNDKFDWFLSEESFGDWKRKLFRIESTYFQVRE